ncbi:MAG: hypothetical protein JWO52_2986 [Gammaproteobacteria bacterium]|nr:hypothetical protein [Gammaproteobacteria bacterium]
MTDRGWHPWIRSETLSLSLDNAPRSSVSPGARGLMRGRRFSTCRFSLTRTADKSHMAGSKGPLDRPRSQQRMPSALSSQIEAMTRFQGERAGVHVGGCGICFARPAYHSESDVSLQESVLS